MLRGFRIIKRKKERQPLDPEVVGVLATLAIKIIGQTVKERATRAVLAGIVAGVTTYLAPQAEMSFSSEPSEPVQVSLQLGTTAEQPHSVCDADHLDWPVTEPVRSQP